MANGLKLEISGVILADLLPVLSKWEREYGTPLDIINCRSINKDVDVIELTPGESLSRLKVSDLAEFRRRLSVIGGEMRMIYGSFNPQFQEV